MSKDIHKLDLYKHGGAHVDRYRRGKMIGRYTLAGLPIKHMGVLPQAIPHADRDRFAAEAAKARVNLSFRHYNEENPET